MIALLTVRTESTAQHSKFAERKAAMAGLLRVWVRINWQAFCDGAKMNR